MNVRERLKEAYENVSFSADRTWTHTPDAYQTNNMELYLTEQHIQRKRLHRNRPRTVRECIPKSRLAQYSNYVYNESREMSYASSTSNCDTNLAIRIPTEPWEMPEVSELYRWFLKKPEDNFSRLEGHYESPLLTVTGFEDKILKIQITEDRVKSIWNKESLHYGEAITKTSQVLVNIFTSPLKNIFLFNSESEYNHEWFRNISITRDFEQVEQLSKSLKEQSSAISKFLAGGTEPVPPPAEPISTEILYSEVLQGLSPSRKFMSSFKSDPGRALPTDEASSVSQDSFTNYTILNSQRAGQDDAPKSDNFSQSNFPKVSQFSTVPQSSNKFVPQKTSTANVYFQTDTQSYARYKYPTNQFPVDSVPRHTRASMVHPFSSYVQQTYFYSPVQTTVQRWIPSNFSSYYPTQIFTSSWFTQNPIMSNRIFGPSPVNATDNREPVDVFNRRFFECTRVEEQFKEETVEIEPFLEEHQVSASVSEELEIQALEQYSNSNENFYQELERQAAEQYTSSPE